MERTKENNRKGKKKTIQPIIREDLNQLRDEVQHEDNTDEILEELLPKVKNIHSAYLFHGYGMLLLQKLCIQISATRSTLYNNGWKEFAYELGIDSDRINVIANVAFGNEDPTLNVIKAYIQDENASMEKILLALKNIKREDIINVTHELFVKFAQKIHENYSSVDQKLLRPNYIQPAPLVLSRLEDEPVEEQVVVRPVYEKYVMLTYATDGTFVAQMVALELRKSGKIGVLILEEHARKVNTDFSTLISDCFVQADYIIPILTIGYLNIISSKDPIHRSGVENLDNKYARYIFKLINSYYIDNMCCNDKIRSIILGDKIDEVLAHHCMLHNELKVWFNSNDVEKLAERILNNTV